MKKKCIQQKEVINVVVSFIVMINLMSLLFIPVYNNKWILNKLFQKNMFSMAGFKKKQQLFNVIISYL